MKRMLIPIVVLVTLIVCGAMIFVFKDKRITLENKYYNNGELIRITPDEFKKIEKNKESFILFVHIPSACQVSLPFAPIVEEFIEKNKITIYSLPFLEITGTSVEEYVRFSPSVLIYENGKVVSYLDSTKDEHLKYYKSIVNFTEWIKEYVKLK